MASGKHPGPDGLLCWLGDRCAEQGGDAARQLRLESDEGLVKVVTLHKSKGLEYPLVFIPFPWSAFKGTQGGDRYSFMYSFMRRRISRPVWIWAPATCRHMHAWSGPSGSPSSCACSTSG